jgi:hypothetical protein
MTSRPPRRTARQILTVLRLSGALVLIGAPVLLPVLVINALPRPLMEGAGAIVAVAVLVGLWITAQFGVPLARLPRDYGVDRER